MKKHRGMSLKALLKLAFSGIFMHPARLAFTILLSAFSIAIAGLSLTAALYDEARVAVRSYVQFTKAFSVSGTGEFLDDKTISDVSEAFRLPLGAVGSMEAVNAYAASGTDMDEAQWTQVLRTYAFREGVHTARTANRIAYFPPSLVNAYGISFLCGGLPKSDDEVAIPSCIAYTLLAGGIGGKQPENFRDLMGKSLMLGKNLDLKICGVYLNETCTAPLDGSAAKCTGRGYTGTVFVNETRFCERAEGIEQICFVGDGKAATGKCIYDFLHANADMVYGDLFDELFLYRENIKTVGASLGGAAGVLGGFSVLMLYHFVSLSVDERKREIGILRALGGRGTDVLFIFLLEQALLGLAIGAISAALTAALLPLFNLAFAALFSVKIALFTFVPFVFPLQIVAATAVSCLSMLPPVLREASRSPAEAIRLNGDE